jgi:CRISPR system Cascade subunit CasA
MTFSSEGKILWCDPSKKPWRNLTALLSTVFKGTNSVFECPQIRLLLLRARISRQIIGIWSGGLKVRVTAGDMNVKQDDDFIDSMILFRSEDMGELWFASLEKEIQALDGLSNKLWRAVNGYQKDMGSNKSPIIEKALAMFWELCDQHSQRIVFSCNDPKKMESLRRTLADHANCAYNTYCPNDSAKQMNAWAKNIPDLYQYLSNQVQEAKSAK